MTYVETLTLFIALLSVVVSFVSLWRTTRLQERMAKAEEAQGRLAERQLTSIEEEAKRTGLADVRALIEPRGKIHRLVIENYGPAAATNVRAQVEPINGTYSPIPQSELTTKLPIEVLAPGETQSLIMALTVGSGTVFRVGLTWTNADGSAGQRQQQVSV